MIYLIRHGKGKRKYTKMFLVLVFWSNIKIYMMINILCTNAFVITNFNFNISDISIMMFVLTFPLLAAVHSVDSRCEFLCYVSCVFIFWGLAHSSEFLFFFGSYVMHCSCFSDTKKLIRSMVKINYQ